MKVLHNGKEVADAKVEFGKNGQPAFVTTKGLRQLASAFTFEDDKPVKKTRKLKSFRKK